MVTLSKLYTGNGDRGKTHLVGGSMTDKFDLRVASYGDLDELNAHLGLIRTLTEEQYSEVHSWIARIQQDLFDIGSLVASPAGSTHESLPEVTKERYQLLEKWIDTLVAPLPPLKSFVLPGGSEINAHLHIARTVCRRAERTLCALADKEGVSEDILIYVNRLSDFLFAAARSIIHKEQKEEFLWVPGKHSS